MNAWQAVLRTVAPQPQSFNSPASTESLGLASRLHRQPAFTSLLRPLAGHMLSGWKWIERKRTQQLATRRLKVAETISLGEKRFVSILQVDGAQFLIGGSTGNISLLAVLDKPHHAQPQTWCQASAVNSPVQEQTS